MSSYAPQLMDYAALKSLHGGSAAVSIGGFVGRGFLMFRVSPLLRARLVRIARHIVDAVLLVSALGFAWMSSQYPFLQGWLTAKSSGWSCT